MVYSLQKNNSKKSCNGEKILDPFLLKKATGVILGGLAGFAWWRFVGCKTGACPITAKWWSSSLYGVILGYIASN